MNKICTSLEQSQRLIELGIDVNTADMIYNVLGESYVRHDTPIDKYHTPAWSLSALLELMYNNSYILRNTSVETNRYNIWTIQRKSPVWCKTPLDAAFEMVCWLKENNKL